MSFPNSPRIGESSGLCCLLQEADWRFHRGHSGLFLLPGRQENDTDLGNSLLLPFYLGRLQKPVCYKLGFDPTSALMAPYPEPARVRVDIDMIYPRADPPV